MKWTEDKINILKQGIDNRLTYKEISEILNIHRNPVRLKAQKLNLKSKYLENLKKLKETKCCEYCEKEFECLISEQRKFCSQSCSTTFNNLKKSNYKKENNLYKKCRNCKKDLINKSKNSIYCSFECNHELNYKNRLKLWINGEIKGYSGKTKALSNFIREYLLEKYNNSCQKCGWNELHPVDKKPLVEINHIDGNAENNKEENLEVLCPNCHSMTTNFRARNKKSSRNRK